MGVYHLGGFIVVSAGSPTQSIFRAKEDFIQGTVGTVGLLMNQKTNYSRRTPGLGELVLGLAPPRTALASLC